MWPFTRATKAEDKPKSAPVRWDMPLLSQAARMAPHVFQAWKTLCATQHTTTVRRLRELVEQDVSDLGGNGVDEFPTLCQQMGVAPAQRVVELMEQDLMRHGQEVPPPGPPPGTVQNSVMEAVRRANKEIDDSFTAAEVAREMGVKVQELSQQFLNQVAELTVALSDVTAKYSEVTRRMQTAPDFQNWANRLDDCLAALGGVAKQQKDIIDRMEMIIANQNTITELFKAFQEKTTERVVTNVVGRLGEQLDKRLEELERLKGLDDVTRALSELIKVNNQIVGLLERRK